MRVRFSARIRESHIRRTWDAAARTGSDEVIGRPEVAAEQLEALFRDLGGASRGDGVCLEIGCGIGRMTTELARRWSQVIAVDVSPEMLDRARTALAAAGIANVTLGLVGGEALDGVAVGAVDTAVCFGVVQHLPSRRIVRRMLAEIGRVLRPGGEAFVQLPLLRTGGRARGWRLARAAAVRVGRQSSAYHGTRLTPRELGHAVESAALDVVARAEYDEDPTLRSRYPHTRDVRLRLRRR